MVRLVHECTKPRDGTALYDAIAAGLESLHSATIEQLRAQENLNVQWLVVLTDGDDNRSTTTMGELIQRLRRYPKVGLIVIVVGQTQSAPQLERMCSPDQRGGPAYFIHAARGGSAAVHEAFGQVKEMITAPDISVESYG